MNNVERQTFEVKEIATYLGVSKDLIYQLVREKKIPFVKLGRRIVFKRDSIDRWMNDQEAMNQASGDA